jgi:hypothetical protein
MKRSSFFWLLISAALITGVETASAQQISGTVVNDEGQPVSGATVFVDMTTLVTEADENGQFTLDAPAYHAFKVVAVADGYGASGVQIHQGDSGAMTISLSAPVQVEGEPLDEDRLSFFKIAAFSYTRSARDIELLTPDVLRHTFDQANNAISVASTGPFMFTNPEMGYQVTIHGFQFGGNAVGYGWGGYTLFEPMTPEKRKDEKKWADNREDAYEGSRRHFLRALMSGNMKQEEWAAWFVGGPGAADDHSPVKEAGLKSVYGEPLPILYEDERPGVGRIDWSGWVRIQYFGNGGDGRWPQFIDRFWPVSDLSEVLASEMNVTFVELPTYQAFIDETGVILPSEGPATNEIGYWTFFRLADMLPLDWMPE